MLDKYSLVTCVISMLTLWLDFLGQNECGTVN